MHSYSNSKESNNAQYHLLFYEATHNCCIVRKNRLKSYLNSCAYMNITELENCHRVCHFWKSDLRPVQMVVNVDVAWLILELYLSLKREILQKLTAQSRNVQENNIICLLNSNRKLARNCIYNCSKMLLIHVSIGQQVNMDLHFISNVCLTTRQLQKLLTLKSYKWWPAQMGYQTTGKLL